METNYVDRVYRSKSPASVPAAQRRTITVVEQYKTSDDGPTCLVVEGNGGWPTLTVEQIERRYTLINPSLEN